MSFNAIREKNSRESFRIYDLSMKKFHNVCNFILFSFFKLINIFQTVACLLIFMQVWDCKNYRTMYVLQFIWSLNLSNSLGKHINQSNETYYLQMQTFTFEI